MPKDVEGELKSAESGSQLMDPSGKAFQDMLVKAQTAAVEKLATKPDTSMVEEKDVKDKPASSAEPPKDEKDKVQTDKPEDETDDIDTLKHQISGLKAELARVRQKNSGTTEEAQGLKERLASMEGQLKVLREGRTLSVAEKLAQLTDEQISDGRVAWDDELSDARVVVRLAEKEGDTIAIKEANDRIANARKMLKHYDTERDRRIRIDAKKGNEEEDTRKGVAAELDTLFESIYKAVPEFADKTSEIWKAGQKEYSALPHLMKQLGPLGELVATANAIAKNPHLIGKKVIDSNTGKVIDDIEKAVDKAFHKGGTTPTKGFQPAITTINSQADLLNFEAQVSKVKGG